MLKGHNRLTLQKKYIDFKGDLIPSASDFKGDLIPSAHHATTCFCLSHE